MFKLLLWLVSSSIGSATTTYDLKGLYEEARKNTSAVQDYQFDEQIARQEKRQAYATVFPSISLNSDTVWREPTSSSTFNDQSHTGSISLSQPLFQGGSEYYSLGVANRLPKIAKFNREQAEIQLYSMVAEAFYSVFRYGRELQTLKGQEDTLKARVNTLEKRAKIGRNKRTDVLAARTQLARVRADLALLENDLSEAQLKLKNLTGLSDLGELSDLQKVPDLVIPNNWDQLLENNPQLKAMELSLESAKKEVSAATGNFLPTVDVEGTYYLEREGFLSDSDWDVTLSASWEILSGGNDYSERKIKKLEYEKLRAQYTDLKRNLKNNYINQKNSFRIKQNTVEKLKAAMALSQSNYRQHVKEANQGLVSQLDVLRALEEYLQVQRAYEQQVYEAKVAYIKLRQLAGVRP